ncbi:MAG: YvcK family protein, partial [Actinobacteria bacterium]|nr:YvcK family protein [Actinomycetota bacterium]
MTQPKVVSLGGGHGLAATLRSLRKITTDLTAIVTVADNGGSSGRLRQEFHSLPPGDLRMALAALCSDDEWGRSWAEIMQYRFTSAGELNGHTLGNLLLTALWDRDEDPVQGLDRVG